MRSELLGPIRDLIDIKEDKSESENDNIISSEDFDKEIKLMGRYIDFQFQIVGFNSKILDDALAKYGWFKNMQALSKCKGLHLLWLSRYGTSNDTDKMFLDKIQVINKIRNLDSLVQTQTFLKYLNKFLETMEQFGKKISNFYLESYSIPANTQSFLQTLDKDMDEENMSNTEFYWYYVKDNKYEKVVESKMTAEFLSKRELYPYYVYRTPTKPLDIYGMNCIISFYVMITSIAPLEVKIHKDGFVKLIQPPFFNDSSNSTKARMMFKDLLKILEGRRYKENLIESLWDS